MATGVFPFKVFPFAYYAVLPDSTLINRVRQQTWNLSELFKFMKTTQQELKRLSKSIKSNKEDMLKLKHAVSLLAAEIRTGFKDLKLINFYDSAILYLYFRLLHHAFGLCKKEEERLMREKEKTLSKELKLKDKKLEDIKKAKEELEEKIKDYEKVIKGLGIAEKELIAVDAKLLNRLRKLRWKAEKRAQYEFSFEELTFRSMENLNRKIKVEATNVKKVIPYKIFLMKKIKKQGINPDDVVNLARLVSEAVDNISKDVSYSSKLIAQFQDELSKLKKILENLKKTIKKVEKGEEKAKEITKPWDDAIKYVEGEMNKDLMQIFRNIFVEYKHIGTRQLAA